MRLWLIALFALCCLWPAQAKTIVYQRHQAKEDPQLRYVTAVLELAIRESGVAYNPRISELVMVQSRGLDELRRNTGLIDLTWTMTSAQREREVLPIRIPIDRGLIGWRVALLKQHRLADFARIDSLQALKRYRAGQMHDWPDTPILRSNGLKVDTSDQYESLFKMLAAGRFDYFPRSLIEVREEWMAHAEMGLAVEPTLLIRYPAALYFFVSKQNRQLAADLERGLNKAVREGKLQALFEQHFGSLLKELNVSGRRVIELRNPLLPPQTPLQRPELWYRPGE